MANPYFNAVYYLTQNPDVFAAGYTVDTAWDHYAQYGANEAYAAGGTTRAPNPWFDVKYYLNNNADLIAAGITPATALDHFLNYGSKANEDRAPNATIAANPITEASLLAYAKGNADLETAFGISPDATELTEAQQNALITHFYAYGYSEDRPDAPTTVEQPDPNQGQTFTLTTGVDIINGTSNDDTIIGDNTGAAKQLAVADQIDGGAGVDTLKVYLAAADTATGQPTLTNIEKVYINGGAITAYTAAAGTTELSIDNASANVAATYTLSGQDLVLANKTSTAATVTTVAASATSTHTAQNITLNGITRDAAANATTIDISGTRIATLNLNATGANSNVALTNTGAAITALNITGDKGLTISAAPAAIVTVDGSDATGAISYTAGTPNGAFKFTGGSANDTVSFADNGLASLLSGAQLSGGGGVNKIAILDTALTATETSRINQAVDFDVLGINAAITLDASTLTSIKSFAVDTAGLTATISNLAAGSSTAINANTTSLTLGTNVGASSTAVEIGGSAGGVTATALVTTGITNVSITSKGTAANTITGITNSDNSVFTIDGSAGLTLSLAAGTAVGSQIDGSAATGVLNLTGSSIIASGDVIKGGSAADIINGLRGADTLTGGAGADTFSFTSTAGANAGGTTFGQGDVITDFVVGTDKLQFAGVVDVVSGQQGAVQNAVTALAAGATAAQIATAMATANTTDLGVSFAVFEGNTYALFETTGASTGVAADDVFIKLTGVTTLPTFAADVIA